MPLKRFRCKECDKVFIAAIEPYEIGRIVISCPSCGSLKLWEEKREAGPPGPTPTPAAEPVGRGKPGKNGGEVK
jgi:phage FluMu protein Com